MHRVTPPASAPLTTSGSLPPCQQGSRCYQTALCIKVIVVLSIALVGTIALLPGGIPTKAQTVNGNCTLIVPEHPLTAEGLATPYQLVATDPNSHLSPNLRSDASATSGPCHEANAAQTAFVQGAVFDPATNRISVYNPLVIDKGTKPAIQPVKPQLPKNAIVALWFGFNGTTLKLQGTGNSLKDGRCVDGTNDSPFGQFAYCNAPAFFMAANAALKAQKLVPPPLGKASNGLTCPSTRDFSVVDMDQSDNVTTIYLALPDGRTAQDTAANRATLKHFTELSNPSDNRLLVAFIDPTLGCKAWMVPDLADKGHLAPALPLDELQASVRQGQPVALVPAGDPMVLVNGQPNLRKLNLYRAGVDQPLVANLNQASTVNYCKNLLNIGVPRLFLDSRLTKHAPSPDTAMASNLFAFLALRFNATWGTGGLNCQGLLNQKSPIVVISKAGVAVDATIKRGEVAP
jgi:hypothetical protein